MTFESLYIVKCHFLKPVLKVGNRTKYGNLVSRNMLENLKIVTNFEERESIWKVSSQKYARVIALSQKERTNPENCVFARSLLK